MVYERGWFMMTFLSQHSEFFSSERISTCSKYFHHMNILLDKKIFSKIKSCSCWVTKRFERFKGGLIWSKVDISIVIGFAIWHLYRTKNNCLNLILASHWTEQTWTNQVWTHSEISFLIFKTKSIKMGPTNNPHIHVDNIISMHSTHTQLCMAPLSQYCDPIRTVSGLCPMWWPMSSDQCTLGNKADETCMFSRGLIWPFWGLQEPS